MKFLSQVLSKSRDFQKILEAVTSGRSVGTYCGSQSNIYIYALLS